MIEASSDQLHVAMVDHLWTCRKPDPASRLETGRDRRFFAATDPVQTCFGTWLSQQNAQLLPGLPSTTIGDRLHHKCFGLSWNVDFRSGHSGKHRPCLIFDSENQDASILRFGQQSDSANSGGISIRVIRGYCWFGTRRADSGSRTKAFLMQIQLPQTEAATHGAHSKTCKMNTCPTRMGRQMHGHATST